MHFKQLKYIISVASSLLGEYGKNQMKFAVIQFHFKSEFEEAGDYASFRVDILVAPYSFILSIQSYNNEITFMYAQLTYKAYA